MLEACVLLPFALAEVWIGMASLADRVGGRLAALIGEQYGKQREIARVCGKSDAWISNIVNGHAKVRLDDLELIATALGMSVADLIDDQPRTMMRLDLEEQDMIGMYRAMPAKVQRHWYNFLWWAVHHKAK